MTDLKNTFASQPLSTVNADRRLLSTGSSPLVGEVRRGGTHTAAVQVSPNPSPPHQGEGTRCEKAASLAHNTGDIVIVGAGLAGLFTALRLAPRLVTVVAAAPLGEGASSAWAQGGIAAAVGEGDTPLAHAADTIEAGAGLVDDAIANMVAAEAPDRIRDLLAYGVPFDRDLAGHFVLSREAAHSAKRIVRVAGDRAGAAIMQALIAAVRATASIRVLEGYQAIDLVQDETRRVAGVKLTRLGHDIYELLPASAVVLATGGIGCLYAVTTNPAHARGEAIAMAARAGATIADAEFVQFHPTAIDVGLDPAPLATESLRGEGAILINATGERFMTARDPRAELAPRDIVARGVFAEIEAGRGAYLDCREAIGKRFPQAFPTVYDLCRDAGIDPVREPIPVAPAAHYHMGGVATDDAGFSGVLGLWVVGEAASTGLHGANRLASNSLLEAVVFGARAADDIAGRASDRASNRRSELHRLADAPRIDIVKRRESIADIRRIMTRSAGVVRSGSSMRRALAAVAAIEAQTSGDPLVANIAVAARSVLAAALLRRESRGGHMRTDFAYPSQRAVRSFLTLADINAVTRSAIHQLQRGRTKMPTIGETRP